MKYICTLCLLLLGSTVLFAQSKTGYINFQQMIGMMPESKLAGDSLNILQEKLNADGQQLVAEYTKKVTEFDSTQGKLSETLKEVKVSEIKALQANIQKYKEMSEQAMNAREQQLLTPILDKAKKILKAVANEKGYTLVIDNSRDAVLVSAEADDLMSAVKVKMGIR
ncbi:periplasmic chaperone for outer membrane proteins Skp [Chitinophaga ginsengisegetis]|uniref:Periplasmic chaperone for outer membrane proteins Skp n=1 Tax=Chitinophaga ginsengisegetis TaxID=393003 RepID=A0A1T5NY60_9BACT|nr:OmpH family outer membrane protein [Chitinophaga ginsengisegetis]MDR6567193.1 outer membrane protein [Chitinophaga ginsengisegetis]MDR6646923.1 outer membrane protein [Chitinophaga ginsengisegetis]MDR6653273.1 outer membrane protein [Chitinophaga ginsengisegetis]SKD05327.1 periplasmic chaperone for outer membrane proteins Skp [Chitinophaga ginsengisegetis]